MKKYIILTAAFFLFHQPLLAEEILIEIGAEIANSSAESNFEVFNQWASRDTIKIDSSPSMKITEEDITGLAMSLTERGIIIMEIDLTTEGKKKLYQMIEKLHQEKGRLALIVDDKIVLLAKFPYPFAMTGSVSLPLIAVPSNVIKLLRRKKGMMLYMPKEHSLSNKKEE